MPKPRTAASGAAPSRGTAKAKPATPRPKRGEDGASRRRLSPEARRAELLAAALTVFSRKGLGEGRHAEVAEEAGASVPTVFFYYPTREALVDAVLDEVARFLLEMAVTVHASDAPADEVILDHIRTFAASVDSSPAHARIWLDWSTAVREQVWQRYLAFLDEMLAIVRKTLERGQLDGSIARRSDPDDQARLLVGSAHMLALMKFSGSPADKLEHFFEALVEAVIGTSRRAAPRSVVAAPAVDAPRSGAEASQKQASARAASRANGGVGADRDAGSRKKRRR